MSKKETKKLIELLSMNLTIPDYQRPYEWDKSNVYVLLEDIMNNYEESMAINIGTIILYKNNDNEYEIVDGQQRIITLSLLLKVLNDPIDIKIFDKEIAIISNAEKRILKNYQSLNVFIKRLEEKDNLNIAEFLKYLHEKVNFYVLESSSFEESFQLFDGRNSKYKDLTPVDLLKAYHLGELPLNYPKNKKIKLLSDWNTNMNDGFSIDKTMNRNEYIFNNVLFNIYNWSLNKDIRPFTKKDIYLYKGYKEGNKKETEYEYVKYYKYRKNNSFQINKPFKAGEEFFEMVKHYIETFELLIKEYDLKSALPEITADEFKYNFKYINYLYYDALLAFYDRFGDNISNFYKETIKDFILRWSLTHRIKNKQVNIQTINYYVLNTEYNFFFECNKSNFSNTFF